MNDYLKERDEINKAYNLPQYRPLKYCAMAVIGMVIILLVATIFCMDKISSPAVLILQGCAGAGAIIFVILMGILSYKVNKEHINKRRKK